MYDQHENEDEISCVDHWWNILAAKDSYNSVLRREVPAKMGFTRRQTTLECLLMISCRERRHGVIAVNDNVQKGHY